MSNTHAVIRTSPKGEDFIGYCPYCGATGLKMIDAQKPCPNATTNLTRLLDALDNKSEKAGE